MRLNRGELQSVKTCDESSRRVPPPLAMTAICSIIANIANHVLNHLASLPIMDIMVKVGESKYDNYGRITCSIKIAELLELVKGEDVVEWHIQNGEVVLRKRTRSYYGFDLESQDIRDRLLAYEEEHLEEAMEDDLNPEERLRKAEEEYAKDKKARAEKLEKEKR